MALRKFSRLKSEVECAGAANLFAQWNFGTTANPIYSMDSWDGYPAQRERVINFIKSKNLNNVIVLTGDVHASWASNLHTDFNQTNSKIFGAEFVGTSITSGGNGADKRADTDQILKQNPHIKFFNDYRGYVRCTVTPAQWRADYRVVPYVTEPGAEVSTRASFIYQKDQTGIRKVSQAAVAGGLKQSNEVEEDRFFAHNNAHEKQMRKKRAKISQ